MSDIQIVTSRENPRAKRLDLLLRQKKARDESGLFVLEGARLCLDSTAAGLRPESVYLTPSAMQRNPGLAAMVRVSPRTVWLDEGLAARLGDTASPQGVFAVLKKPAHVSVEISERGKYILLYRVRDPGNLGGILRTAAALGADGAFLCECAELYSPKVLRASMGGVWRFPVLDVENMAEQVNALRRSEVEVYAAADKNGALSPGCLAGAGGKAVLIGNEGDGLPDSLIAACGGGVAIPMKNGSESLNAAMAAGILLWEMLRHDGNGGAI